MILCPVPLHEDHDVSGFFCGEPSLDDWLKRRAIRNQLTGASRTYVIFDEQTLVGYYALSTGSVAHVMTPGKIKRNMPDPVPVIILGRLAVHMGHHRKGLGTSMLQDAILRTLQAAEIAGIRALLVHAINEQAAEFYRHAGFNPSPVSSNTLMLLLNDARAALQND